MELVTYMFKVSACSALFFVFYLLVLRKLTFFRLNRFYLLSGLILAFVIPALQIDIERAAPVISAGPSVALEGLAEPVSGDAIAPANSLIAEGFEWTSRVDLMYTLVVICLLLTLAYRLIRLSAYTKSYTKTFNGLKLVRKANGFTNCSFFNYVFINEDGLPEADLNILLRHEEVHAQQYHSIDKIIIALCKAFLWFNPIIYLYDKALEQVHEYEADEAVAESCGTRNYASLLLALAVAKQSRPLVHNFVKNPVKERIKMLFNTKSGNMKKWIYLLSLPAMLMPVGIFSVKVVYAAAEINTSGVIADTVHNDTLRLVGNDILGENPRVIIDGKDYDPEILTRISPRCIRTTSTGPDFIRITTKDNQIEYATKTDIANARIKQKAEKSDRFYLRYSLKHENGENYDVVRIKSNGSTGAASIPHGVPVLILIDGKKYTEEEAENLNPSIIKEGSGLSVTTSSSGLAELAGKYGTGYKAVFRIPAE